MTDLTDIGRSLECVMTETEIEQRIGHLRAMWKSVRRPPLDLTRKQIEEIADEFMLHGPFDTISFWRDLDGLRWRMSNSGYSSDATDRRSQALADMANGIITPDEGRSIIRGVPVEPELIKTTSDEFYASTKWHKQYDQPLRTFAVETKEFDRAVKDWSATAKPKPWRPPYKPPYTRLQRIWRHITWTLVGA